MRLYVALLSLLFMSISYTLTTIILPDIISYYNREKFYEEMYYNEGDIPDYCFYNYGESCYISLQLYISNSMLSPENNFECALYVNNTDYFAPGYVNYNPSYNSTHSSLGCIFALSPFDVYCSTYNTYNFTFLFNGTALPQIKDENIVIIGNLSYYYNSTTASGYKMCNITYSNIFLPSPLPSLTPSYIPLNGTRTYDSSSGVIYSYVDDYFLILANTSNIRDAQHSGKLKDAWVNITKSSFGYLQFLNNSYNKFLGNLSSGESKLTSWLFKAQSIYAI